MQGLRILCRAGCSFPEQPHLILSIRAPRCSVSFQRYSIETILLILIQSHFASYNEESEIAFVIEESASSFQLHSSFKRFLSRIKGFLFWRYICYFYLETKSFQFLWTITRVTVSSSLSFKISKCLGVTVQLSFKAASYRLPEVYKNSLCFS